MSKSHNDRPVLECQLKRVPWRDAIINQIKHAAPPKVIAIHGTWGTGKTSILAQMYRKFGGEQFFKEIEKEDKDQINSNEFHPIWFEAWQYQHEENILAALLKEIRDQLAFKYKFLDKLDEGLVIGLTSLLQSIDLTFEKFGFKFGFNGFAKNVRDNVKEYENERFAGPLNSVMMKKMLKNAIDQLLQIDRILGKKEQKDDRRAIIFIDDLDRCEPETAFRILESIKVYLDLDNCVFVLGMDVHAVDHMLAKHYEKQFKGDKDFNHLKNISRLYLEKICQDIFHLPVPSIQARVDYFKSLLLQYKNEEEEKLINKLVTLAEKYKILPPFPRSIKIFANVMLSHLGKEEITIHLSNEPTRKEFLIITYLYAFHFEVYQLCYSYPDFYNFTFLEYCKNPFEFKTEKGEHPALTSLIIHMNKEKITEVAEGSEQKFPKNQLLTSIYPHANLRQVLWIGDLVSDTGSFPEGHIEKLKL